MTEEQAETKLSAELLEQSCKFCPIIKELCKLTCASLYRGNVEKEGYEDLVTYEVRSPRCNNPNVTGNLNLQGYLG